MTFLVIKCMFEVKIGCILNEDIKCCGEEGGFALSVLHEGSPDTVEVCTSQASCSSFISLALLDISKEFCKSNQGLIVLVNKCGKEDRDYPPL